MSKLIVALKFLVKYLPYLIAALTGAGATAVVSGCKCGSIISIVP